MTLSVSTVVITQCSEPVTFALQSNLQSLGEPFPPFPDLSQRLPVGGRRLQNAQTWTTFNLSSVDPATPGPEDKNEEWQICLKCMHFGY